MISKKSLILFLIALLTSTSIWAQEPEEINGVFYDVVTITVDNITSYNESNKPVIAPVKYNKLCPLVITSDDMGAGELARNWAFFNGYPVFANDAYGQISMGNDFLDTPYSASAWAQQVKGVKRNTHQPLTYSDDTGGVRRFTATSAIWPHQVNNTNPTLINKNDAKVMIRTGWSFAQHDVDDAYTTNASTIAGRFKALSEDWESKVGIGLKVLVEPTGDHNYIDAGKQSDEICWNIFQNGDDTHAEMTNTLISDWTSGTDWTTFGSNKPDATTRRIFFQGHESEWTSAINSSNGNNMIIGGTHGIGDDILSFTKELAIGGSSEKADQFWVAGADEVWEYYHLYNNAKITDVSYADGTLTFKVKVPQYAKNQFRELTINIPGITGGTTCTFSNNVITGSARQNDNYYTINFGLENKINTYIDELITYYRGHLHNQYVKDDAQYLIDRLLPDARPAYQARLDAAPTYGTYSVKTDVNNKTLISGAQDAAAAVTYTFPKYLRSGTDLYQATANGSQPFYVTTFTPNAGTDNRTVNYTKVEGLHEITFFSEGEDLDGAHYNPKAMSNINDSGKGEYMPWHRASNGAGGYINNNEVITVTTVQPGKYNLVVAAGDSFNDATHWATFTFKLGDKTIFSFQTDKQDIKEYTKEAIVVKEPLTLTVQATESTTSRWIDYLYLEKIAEYDETVPEISLTASPSSTIDVTNGTSPVIITATATGYQSTGITQTVIKDAEDHILASANGNTCQYEYTPTQLGNIVFIGEATDAQNRTGISEDFTVTVKSNFTLTAQSNFDDELANTTFENQTADLNYRFLYPRYLLKGTNLYETVARSNNSNQLHYGEELTFSLTNKNIERTINYNTLTATNIIFYVEGENVEGVGKWTNASFDKNQGQSYALTLGSMGTAGGFKSETQGSTTVTTLPAGQYQLTAIIGSTNAPATYAFKAGEASIGSLTPTKSTESLTTYTTNPFTLEGDTPITISSTQGTSNSQNWVDLIYIQKLDDVPVTISSAGYATFSSPYALDFTNSNIKVYTATVEDNKVTMTKVNNPVPAATGLFLQGAAGTENIPLATSIPPTIANNALMPHLETGIVTAGNYVFSKDKNSGDLSFRRLGSDTEVPGGRAYLTIPNNDARNLTIEMDDVTGIRLVPMEPATLTSPAYNIQGLPVSEHTKGIIIRNGRKYINTKKQ